MATPTHKHTRVPNDPGEIVAIPPDRVNKNPQRRIYNCFHSGLGELKASHPRFGPIYSEDESLENRKEDAWQHILKKSPDEKAVTLETYLSAMKKIELEARATYADGALKSLTESRFRWMMIKDGCFFLQLALFILGCSEQLEYTDNHHTFGKKQNNEKTINGWIESMFFVGNQIPLVVLNELMKQSFFQNVIAKGQWEKPPDTLCKQVLYELLILPVFGDCQKKSSPISTWKERFFQHLRKSETLSSCYWLKEKPSELKEQPSDLLHGLQQLVLGPKGSEIDSFDDEPRDGDLEAGTEDKRDDKRGNDPKLCASQLKKKGIHFRNSKESGCRGIGFEVNMFCARLFLPTVVANDETETIFRNLKYYEIHQKQNEVRSYLWFMSELLSTYEDVNILASKGIIRASTAHHKEKFLRMLRKLGSREITQNHRYVMFQLRDYSRFAWENFKWLAIAAFVVTVIQAITGVLSYIKQVGG